LTIGGGRRCRYGPKSLFGGPPASGGPFAAARTAGRRVGLAGAGHAGHEDHRHRRIVPRRSSTGRSADIASGSLLEVVPSPATGGRGG